MLLLVISINQQVVMFYHLAVKLEMMTFLFDELPNSVVLSINQQAQMDCPLDFLKLFPTRLLSHLHNCTMTLYALVLFHLVGRDLK